MRDIYAACAICVALELPNQRLVVEIPHSNIAVAATGEADFCIRADCQSVACWGRGGQFSLDPWRRGRQVPDRKRTRFPSHNQGAAIGEEFAGTDVVVSVQAIQLRNGTLTAWLADIPDLHTSLSSGVHVSGWIANGHSTYHLPVTQCVDLPSVPWDAGASKGIMGEWDRLHLPISTYVKRVGWLPAGYGRKACGETGASHGRMRVKADSSKAHHWRSAIGGGSGGTHLGRDIVEPRVGPRARQRAVHFMVSHHGEGSRIGASDGDGGPQGRRQWVHAHWFAWHRPKAWSGTRPRSRGFVPRRRSVRLEPRRG